MSYATWQTRLSLHDTFCLVGHDSEELVDVLHTATFLEQRSVYPVVHNYTFGVPLLKSSCQCRCPLTAGVQVLS